MGEALAFLCLHFGETCDKRVGEQAEFLSRLGCSEDRCGGALRDQRRVFEGTGEPAGEGRFGPFEADCQKIDRQST
jgi:hypothetical protein